jgi:hypothetical protein
LPLGRSVDCFAAALPPLLFFGAAGLVSAVRFVVAFLVLACFAVFFGVAAFFAAALAPLLRGLVTRAAPVFFAAVSDCLLVTLRSVFLARTVSSPEFRGLAVRLSAGFFGVALPLVFLGLAARGAAETFD